MNIIVLIGRLTKDPEIKQISDTYVCNIILAVDRETKNKITDFIPCSLFGNSANYVSQYLKKGDLVCVKGSLRISSVSDGKRYTTVAGDSITTIKKAQQTTTRQGLNYQATQVVAPTQQMPAQQMPAQQMPAQQRPAQQMPIQQMPAQQMPAQQMPAQQMPVQQSFNQTPYAFEVCDDDLPF